MRPRLIYLHGFASSPGSFKAVQFARALGERNVPLQIPDLNEGDFTGLTLSRQLALVDRLSWGCPPASVLLIGSSLGAYVAALFAARDPRPAGLVLMAPAFDFIRRWTERLGPAAAASWQHRGTMEVMHFGADRMLPIGWSLAEDAARHPAFPEVQVPTLILHGRRDEVVDWRLSQSYAADRPTVELEILDSDHGLGDVIHRVIERSLEFLSRWL